MLFNEDFARAFVHRRASRFARRSAHKILGLRLRPFSHWHAANLDFIASPFAPLAVTFLADARAWFDRVKESALKERAGIVGLFSELWLALECCQLSYPQVVSSINPVRHIRRVIGTREYAKNPERTLDAFLAYIEDYAARPQVITSEQAKPAKSPWYLYEVATLVQNSRLSLAQAWDMPVGESAWLAFAFNEARGENVDLLTPEDREQLKELGIEI